MAFGKRTTSVDVADFMVALDTDDDVIEQWRGRPLELAEKLGVVVAKKPLQVMKELGLYDGDVTPGQRELIEEVCLGKVKNAAVLSGRGAGKSLTVAFIELYMFLFEGFDCINLGGTKKQAESVYNHIKNFLANQELNLGGYCETIQTEKITGVNGSWIRLLAASEKAIRSPHAGGRKIDGRMAGGMLVIDEESKADPNMVVDALPMINTGDPQVTIRLSTFDEATGTFSDLIANHKEYGFKLYNWDTFDISTPCDCTTEGTICGSREECFREPHYEEVINENTGLIEKKLQHRAYCELGKTKYSRGFMPFLNIEDQWKMTGRQHAKFEINYLGWRPSTTGYVIRDMLKFNNSVVDERPADLYGRGPTWICVDWGSSHGGLTVWQRQKDKETGLDRHVLLEAVELEGMGLTDTMGLIKRMWDTYRLTYAGVAADVGYGGYTNDELYQRFKLKVTPVNFGVQKEDSAAVFNIFNENESLVIPKEHQAYIDQVNNWRRTKNGAIQKGKDHLCDSSLCYFSTFVEEIGKTNIYIPPVSFTPGEVWQDGKRVTSRGRTPASGGRSATIVGFGNSRKTSRDNDRFMGMSQRAADRWKHGPPKKRF